MWESGHVELPVKRRCDFVQIACRNHDVEIQADDRIDVRVGGLGVNETPADARVPQEREQLF